MRKHRKAIRGAIIGSFVGPPFGLLMTVADELCGPTTVAKQLQIGGIAFLAGSIFGTIFGAWLGAILDSTDRHQEQK